MPLVNRTFDQLIDFTRTSAATFVNSSGNIASTPQSRNLLTFTQEFSNAAWTKTNATITANSTAAPDGTSTADTFIETAAAGVHNCGQSVTTSAVPYTFSCYVKAGTRTFAMLYHTQTNAGVSINLSTGATATPSGLSAPTSSSVTAVGNGWYRLSMTVTATAASNFFGVYVMTSLNTYSYTGDGTSGIFIWGAQLEFVPDASLTLGSEVVANGDFSGGATGWTTGAGWAIGSGVATATATNASLLSGSAVTAGKTYRVAFDVTSYTAGTLSVRVGTGAAQTVTSAGSRVLYLTAVNTAGVEFYGGGITLSLDNVSVREITGTTGMPSDYTRNFGGLFPPRFDYDPVTRAPRGLLIEEQRTNLLTYSEQFDNAAWTLQRATVTANAATSPDGTADADRLVDDTATGTHRVFQAVSKAASAIAYTGSVYLKADTLGFATVRIAGLAEGAYTSVGINLSTGELSALGTVGFTSASAAVANAGNGWWRVALTGTSDTTTSISLLVGTATSLAAGSSYTGTGTGSIYIYGAQLEAGAFATSYIPTVASQVTRSADSAVIQAPNFASWYNQSEGTFVIEAMTATGLRSGSQGLFSVNDGTTSNVMNAARQATGLVRFNGTGSPAGDVTSVSTAANGAVSKMAFTFRANDWGMSLNGAAAVTDTSAVVPSVIRLGIGSLDGLFDAGAQWGGHIRSIRFYPTRLTSAQLQALTA